MFEFLQTMTRDATYPVDECLFSSSSGLSLGFIGNGSCRRLLKAVQVMHKEQKNCGENTKILEDKKIRSDKRLINPPFSNDSS